MFLQRWLKSFLLSIFYLSLVFLSHFLTCNVWSRPIQFMHWELMHMDVQLHFPQWLSFHVSIVCENNAPINRVPSSWSGLRICFQIKVNRKIAPFKEKTLFLNFCNDILGSMDTDMDTDMGSDTFEKIRTWTP